MDDQCLKRLDFTFIVAIILFTVDLFDYTIKDKII